MGIDTVAGPPPDLIDKPGKFAVGDVHAVSAGRAHEVVMVFVRIAQDVRMSPGRQIEPLDHAQGGEQVQCPENRGPPDVDALLPATLQ